MSNNQVYWISEDEDVQDFFMGLIQEYEGVLDDDEQAQFWYHFS